MSVNEENKDRSLLFEKFKIISCLKKDILSSVYLADHIYLNKKIVLKILHTASLSDSSVLERFKREAKILARLDHPNIIRVLDFGQSGSDFYLSFEFFDSRNLREVLHEEALDSIQKKNIFIQLLQGLATAHQAGIIHRDIKPENLLINEQGQLKLADFGLAQDLDETALTKKSSIVGTPAYMSPEQIRGEMLTPQSDLFSLGIVLYEIYHGKNPFAGHDINSTFNTILSGDLPPIMAAAGERDEKIDQLITGCLQRDKNKRIKSASAMLEIMQVERIEPSSRSGNGKKNRIKPVPVIMAASALVIILSLIWLSEQAGEDAAIPEPIISPPAVSSEPDSVDNKDISRDSPAADLMKVQVSSQHQIVTTSNQGNFILTGTPYTTIWIDSQEIGQIPLNKTVSLPAGIHDLKLLHKDFPAYSQKLQILPGENQIMHLSLDTLFGYLNCRIYPWGELYLDGIYKGQSPFLKPLILAPGKHLLTISNPTWPEFRDTIMIFRKDTTNYRINFEQIDHLVRSDTMAVP